MNKQRILIVDDEMYDLILLEKTLGREDDYEIIKTTDPEHALAILNEQAIDLIISDHHMPQMSGLDMLAKMQEIAPETIRIITTGYPDDSLIREAYATGIVQQFIPKPWHPQAMLITVRNTFEHFRLKAEKAALAKEMAEKIRLIRQQAKTVDNFDSLKKQFMMIANHELRTPATIITASLDILASQKEHLNASQLKFVTNALGGARRLNELLEKFCGILKYNQQLSAMNREAVNVNNQLATIRQEIEPHLQRRDITLNVYSPGDLSISADYSKMYQVFLNLISNAIKYSPDGATITISAQEIGDEVLIAVKDKGVGIPTEELENIFKDFYQLGDTMKHHSSQFDYLGSGAGLGLSYCKSIVSAFRGSIWAESDGEGLGSTLFLKLPSYRTNTEMIPVSEKQFYARELVSA